MADVAFAVVTIAVFALVALVAKGVAKLWPPKTSSAWSWPSPCSAIWSSPSSSRRGS